MAYLGQAGALALAAASNVAVTAYHAHKVSKMQRKFQKHLERDAANIDYMKNIVTYFTSAGNRVAVVSGFEPGTSQFEFALMKALKKEMNYKGNCVADIYVPPNATDIFNTPVWARVTRSGYVEGPVPRDVGPIWATGCKNAQSEFRINYIKAIKSRRRFETGKIFREKLATSEIISKFVIGSLLIMMMVTVIKLQLAK